MENTLKTKIAELELANQQVPLLQTEVSSQQQKLAKKLSEIFEQKCQIININKKIATSEKHKIDQQTRYLCQLDERNLRIGNLQTKNTSVLAKNEHLQNTYDKQQYNIKMYQKNKIDISGDHITT